MSDWGAERRAELDAAAAELRQRRAAREGIVMTAHYCTNCKTLVSNDGYRCCVDGCCLRCGEDLIECKARLTRIRETP